MLKDSENRVVEEVIGRASGAFDYEAFFESELTRIKHEGRYRVFVNLARIAGMYPAATLFGPERQRVKVWCSNDYLGMGQHPAVLQAMHATLDAMGAGAGGTRNISGTTPVHVALEHELADLHQKEGALLFNSGYMANWATLSTLARLLPGCVVLSDEENHASIIEGIRHSRAQKVVFRHNDLMDLEQKLRKLPADCPRVIVFESIYSMSGSQSPVREIVELAERYNALTYLDEVHSVGLYGPEGAGVAALEGVQDRVSIIQGTLAKAYGVAGGYIAGPAPICDFVRSFASGFIFTTSLSPALCAGALASVRFLRNSDFERITLQLRVLQSKNALQRRGVPSFNSTSHIIPVRVGEAQRCKRVSDELLARHAIYVQPINYPTVPFGTERLRVTPSPWHSEADIEALAFALADVLLTAEVA